MHDSGSVTVFLIFFFFPYCHPRFPWFLFSVVKKVFEENVHDFSSYFVPCFFTFLHIFVSMEKNPVMFCSQTISFRLKKEIKNPKSSMTRWLVNNQGLLEEEQYPLRENRN